MSVLCSIFPLMYDFNVFSCFCRQELEDTAMSARLWIIQIMFMKLGWVYLFCICIWMCVMYSTTWWFKSCLKIVLLEFCCQPMTASHYILTGHLRCDYIAHSRYKQNALSVSALTFIWLLEARMVLKIPSLASSAVVQSRINFVYIPWFLDHVEVYFKTRLTAVKVWCSSLIKASKICQRVMWLHFTYTVEATFCLLYPCLASWGFAGFWQVYYQYVHCRSLDFKCVAFGKHSN